MVDDSTGMRNFELRQLQVKDINSKSLLIHIQRGKGGRDRYVPLSPKLLETLREYWRWMKPKTWLFPGRSTTGAPINPSLPRWSGMPVNSLPTAPASRNAFTPTF